MNEDCNMCCVCALTFENMVLIEEKSNSDMKLRLKLSLCVPKVEWKEHYRICIMCIEELEKVYSFYSMCIKSSDNRRNALIKLNETLIDDNPDCNNSKVEATVLKDNQSSSSTSSPSKLENEQPTRNTISEENVLPLYCKLCDKQFKTNSQYTRHTKSQCNNKYSCKKCDLTFKTMRECSRHRMKIHTKPEKWKHKCDICSNIFSSLEDLKEHQKDDCLTVTKTLDCKYCNENFDNNEKLQTHVRLQHFADAKQGFCCEICLHYFDNEIDLENHLKEVHKFSKEKTSEEDEKVIILTLDDYTSLAVGQDIVTFKENDDGSELNTDSDAEQILSAPEHRSQKRNPKKSGGSTLSCEKCGASFGTKYLLNRHVKNVHATEKLHSCEECGQKFVSPVYLSAHKRYHSGDRSHICSFCGKGYITASDLYHHEKTHANKRAYKCALCPKAFNTSSDLHKHKICVHQDRSMWKYVCTYCDRRFPLKTNLDTHTKIHTGERNFQCHLCDRRCINRSVLQRHIESHSNVRSYKCDVCDQEYKHQKSLDIHRVKAHGIGDIKVPIKTKKFFCHICPKSYYANNKLEKHIRTHTGERPFPCSMCDKRFIDKSYIKQHMRSAHKVTFNS